MSVPDIGKLAASSAAPPQQQSVQTLQEKINSFSKYRKALFNYADQKYKEGDIQEAIKHYIKASQTYINGKGCAHSCYTLYLIYYYGFVIEKDIQLEKSYYNLYGNYSDSVELKDFIDTL
jgi:hypothetical protein